MFEFTCPNSGCGEKIVHKHRGYAQRKAFTHLRKVHGVKSICVDKLDSYIREVKE